MERRARERKQRAEREENRAKQARKRSAKKAKRPRARGGRRARSSRRARGQEEGRARATGENKRGINARADAHDHIRAKLLQAKTIKGRANLQKMSARIPKIAENANVYHNVTGIFNVRITSCT